MIKRILLALLLIFLCSNTRAFAKETQVIEIYNISYERIDKIVRIDYEIQKLVENYINGIEGLYHKFNPIPDGGFAVKVPLAPAVTARTKGINSPVDQVIVMFPENEEPFLLIFEEDGRLSCFTFKGDTGTLIESLEYEPNTYSIKS